MPARGVMLAAAVAICGSPAAALPVRVAFDWPSGSPAAPRSRVVALQTAGPTAGGAPIEAEAGADGAVLDLGEGVWQVQASAEGYWSEGAEVVVGAKTPPSVRLQYWPAASLHGAITMDGGQETPKDVAVRLTAVTPADERAAPAAISPARAELRCRVDGGAWACAGPAGLFDVRIEAAGYAPRYVWDVSLPVGRRADLGRTVLRRAASVAGRAIKEDGLPAPGPCRAMLRAEVRTRGPAPPDPGRAGENGDAMSAPVGPHGHFQLVGMAPGGYVLAVVCAEGSAVRELRVEPARESRIDPPLRLEDLRLDVLVAPASDPEGRPWQLSVDATAPHARPIADKEAVPADGRFVRRGLTAGTYRVALVDQDGTQRLLRFVELRPGSRPLSLRLGFAGVAGRVLLGTTPLRARLVFANEAGGEPVTLTSDDDGRFQGLLPAGRDAAESFTVEVEGTESPVRRRLEGVRLEPSAGTGTAAWLELRLPIAVRGTVATEAGRPQVGAQVSFENTDSGARTLVTTDDAGRFEVIELPPGSYTAVASSAGGASERVRLDVAVGVPTEVHLILRSERLTFSVVGSQGPVASAAVQVWIPPGVPRGFARTDPEGRFQIDLPPGITEVGLTIGAPGHALKMTRLAVSSDSSEETVTLAPFGGTLRLDLRATGTARDPSATPYLVHDGAVEAAGALAGWGTADDASGRGPAAVEAIEPGVYALCMAGPDDLAELWRGTLSASRCRTGSVEPGGTLTLSPP